MIDFMLHKKCSINKSLRVFYSLRANSSNKWRKINITSDILLEKKIMNICIAEDIYSLQETTKNIIRNISSHWKKSQKKKKRLFIFEKTLLFCDRKPYSFIKWLS